MRESRMSPFHARRVSYKITPSSVCQLSDTDVLPALTQELIAQQ